MSDKNLVICDKEFRYAKNLMENIAERKELALKVYAYKTLDKVNTFSKERGIDIFIADEDWSENERMEIPCGQRFVLVAGGNGRLSDKEIPIYKYQSADQILSEIFETYLEYTNENVVKTIKKIHQKIIAVYSPVHRAGKTRFAIALGKELQERTKVLYLNMEEYTGFGTRFEREDSRNLGDLLYYTKQEHSNVGIRIGMMVKQIENLDYIPPIPVCNDLKEVTLAEWKLLLEQIMQNSIYEMLILDIGESIQGLFEILRLCDKIYMPVLTDAVSQEKLHQYEKNLSWLNLDGLKDKTHCFVVAEDVKKDAVRMAKEVLK